MSIGVDVQRDAAARARGSVRVAESIELDAAAALIVVDVQNDFADRLGAVYVDGGERVVGVINGWVARALERSALVVYTRDWHPPITPHFSKYGGGWPQHCVRDSWGAEAPADLVVAGPVVYKGMGGEDGYSGFFTRNPVDGTRTPTALNQLLRAHGVQNVWIIGLSIQHCVKATALDARALGYRTVVLAEAMRSDASTAVTLAAVEELRARGVEVR